MAARVRSTARVRWRMCGASGALVYLALAWGAEGGRTASTWAAAAAAVGFALGTLLDQLAEASALQRESEARYRRATRGASAGLWEWELSSGRAEFSDRFCELAGLSRGELGEHIDGFLSHVHPDDLTDLRASIDGHVAGRHPRLDHELRLRRGDGAYLWVHVQGMLDPQVAGGGLLTAWTADISARKSAEQDLRFHAFRDPLTGLPNRSLFIDRLGQAVLQCQEGRDLQIAVLLIDLDRFKRVNDSLGHSAGDSLLLAVTDRLRGCVREGDTVARLGGDEFGLLLQDVSAVDHAVRMAERVRTALLEPVTIKGRAVTSGCSIGIVVTDARDMEPADIVRDADTAMYRAKDQGRGHFAIFDPSMRTRAVARLTLEGELRRALAQGQFEVRYQPIVASAGVFAGFEALPRWRHPRLGLLLPGDFIQLAEETGLIVELGDYVMGEACCVGQRVAGRVPHGAWTVHVNLSPRQIQRADTASRILRTVQSSGLDPQRLCVEVTEDVILDEVPTGGALFAALRDQGVKLCMDDFGTGYSSLSYLHRFRVDFLKIETAFVHGAETREGGLQIVRSLVNLSRNLGITAVAEGVETQAQWDLLRGLGCPLFQGFFFAEPLTVGELERWVDARMAACA